MTDQNQPPTEPNISHMTEIYEQKPPKNSGLAITSMILGIIGFVTCGITAPLGLVLGIISLIQVNRNKETVTGQSYAVAGIVTSALAFFMIPIMAAILFPVFAKGREAARTATCISNANKIGMAMVMYSKDNDDNYPVAGNWTDSISSTLTDKASLICPSAQSDQTGYAMNKKLSGMSLNMLQNPPDTIMNFDSTPGDNPNGGIELLPNPARHMMPRSREERRIERRQSGYRMDTGVNSIAFADAHVKPLTVEAAKAMVWDPSKQ